MGRLCSRKYSLRGKENIRILFQKGKSRKGPLFLLRYLITEQGNENYYFLFASSASLPTRVKKNRIKRILRAVLTEVVAERQYTLPIMDNGQSLLMALIGTPELLEKTHAERKREMARLMNAMNKDLLGKMGENQSFPIETG